MTGVGSQDFWIKSFRIKTNEPVGWTGSTSVLNSKISNQTKSQQKVCRLCGGTLCIETLCRKILWNETFCSKNFCSMYKVFTEKFASEKSEIWKWSSPSDDEDSSLRRHVEGACRSVQCIFARIHKPIKPISGPSSYWVAAWWALLTKQTGEIHTVRFSMWDFHSMAIDQNEWCLFLMCRRVICQWLFVMLLIYWIQFRIDIFNWLRSLKLKPPRVF